MYMNITPSIMGLPDKINNLQLQPLSWNHFTGDVPPHPKYQAHLFWYVRYNYWEDQSSKKYVTVQTQIMQTSWKTSNYLSFDLLAHEYGHYLIACLMALTFEREANAQGHKFEQLEKYEQFCKNLFDSIYKEHLHLEELYDNDTQHYHDKQKQRQWQIALRQKLLCFKK